LEPPNASARPSGESDRLVTESPSRSRCPNGWSVCRIHPHERGALKDALRVVDILQPKSCVRVVRRASLQPAARKATRTTMATADGPVSTQRVRSPWLVTIRRLTRRVSSRSVQMPLRGVHLLPVGLRNEREEAQGRVVGYSPRPDVLSAIPPFWLLSRAGLLLARDARQIPAVRRGENTCKRTPFSLLRDERGNPQKPAVVRA
jgi:hypothetical protein